MKSFILGFTVIFLFMFFSKPSKSEDVSLFLSDYIRGFELLDAEGYKGADAKAFYAKDKNKLPKTLPAGAAEGLEETPQTENFGKKVGVSFTPSEEEDLILNNWK